MLGPSMAPPPHPQRGMAADNDSAGPQPRKSDGTRPKNGTHLCREYGLLEPEETEKLEEPE